MTAYAFLPGFIKRTWLDPGTIEARLKRELDFDVDLWIVEVEDRLGRNFLDLADAS